MAIEYGWDGSNWVALTSAPAGTVDPWGEHLVTWDGTLWHYRGSAIVARPEANYAEGSRVVWDTSQDVTFTDPPPLMEPGDLWVPHETVSGEGSFLPLTGGTLTGDLYITEGSSLTVEDGITVDGGGIAVNGITRSYFEAPIEATGGMWLEDLPTDPIHAVNKQYADSLVMSGPMGPPGGALLSAQWNFNQTTTISPNSGNMRMNATTYAAVTYLWIHEIDRDGLDRSAGLNELDVGDQIIMQSAQGRAVWNVTSHADSGVYRTIGVTLVESAGTRPSASSPTTIYIVTGGASAGHTIQDEGTARTARAALNFVGPAVAATDDSANDRTLVTISTPNILVLGPADPVPGGTPAGTVIVRTT